jgi:hypothetical protein
LRAYFVLAETAITTLRASRTERPGLQGHGGLPPPIPLRLLPTYPPRPRNLPRGRKVLFSISDEAAQIHVSNRQPRDSGSTRNPEPLSVSSLCPDEDLRAARALLDIGFATLLWGFFKALLHGVLDRFRKAIGSEAADSIHKAMDATVEEFLSPVLQINPDSVLQQQKAEEVGVQ